MLYAFSPDPPTSSVEAFQDRSTCPQVATAAVKPVGELGGVTSVTWACRAREQRTSRVRLRRTWKVFRLTIGWSPLLNRCLSEVSRQATTPIGWNLLAGSTGAEQSTALVSRPGRDREG